MPSATPEPEILRVVMATYAGSDGAATMALYARLLELGPAGDVAVNLFRASKASDRAKQYRNKWTKVAYGKKEYSLANLAKLLLDHGAQLGITRWGWEFDDKAIGYEHVLYVELPTGQVSFHAPARGEGPDYGGEWDGMKGAGPGRVITWCARLLSAPVSSPACAPGAAGGRDSAPADREGRTSASSRGAPARP